jgi:hypothetical protein
MAKTTVPIELSSTPSIVDNGNATAITIDSSQNVGIGTTSPTGKLNIVSGSTASYLINLDYDDNTDGGGFYQSGSTDLSLFLKNSSATQTVQIATAGDSYFNGGNVGIGTSSPAQKLEVVGGGFQVGNGTVTTGISYSSVGIFGTFSNHDLTIRTNNTEKMRIDTSGNLLVGTTSAVTGNSLATVATGITASSSTSPALQLYCSGAGSNQKYWRWTSKTTGDIRLEQVNDAYTSPTQRLRIDSSGYLYNPSMLGSASANSDVRFNTSDGLIYYQTSSRRYKENIQDLPSMLDKVNALRAVTFDEIATGESCYGLIAEEVFEQIPELVNLKEVEGYDTPQPDNIPYSMLSVFLLKAIQEQQTIIEDLKARITALENA